jgi:hypothetical protein
LRRLNVKTGYLTSITIGDGIWPVGIVCLSGSGIIVISCSSSLCLWTIDPRTNYKLERLAGALTDSSRPKWKAQETDFENPFSIRFREPCGIAWYERDQSILVADTDTHSVFRVPLPDRVFTSPKASPDTPPS